jgi:hypothetical protein
MSPSAEEPKTRKKSTVRHTRAIQYAHTKRPVSAPTDEQVRERLTELVHPATLGQVSYFHSLGLRARTLNLVVMMAFVLELIWRQISGVCELTRIVQDESVLWASPVKVSQQALSERLTTMPAELFERVLANVLPVAQQRWHARQRPQPAEIAWALAHYSGVYAADGSTLDALIRKIGLLQDQETNPLAGRITALLDLGSRLPTQVWYEPDSQAHDQRFWPDILKVLPVNALMLIDMGYINFYMFAQMTQQNKRFITRAKSNLAFEVAETFFENSKVRDRVIWVGTGESHQQLRLVEILYRGKWFRYLTNELDAKRLPTAYVVALYWQRWRIEDAYNLVKRLLGLAYFWCGAQNAVRLQVWATWLLYVVLIDLTDAVAEALHLPFSKISIEMVYRSLYFFTQARQRGAATDLVEYLAQNTKLLGIVKRKHKSDKPDPLTFVNSLTAS